MVNEINNNKSESMMLDLYKYKSVLDGDSVYNETERHLKEAAFGIILGNTATKRNVFPEDIEFIRKEFEKFSSASKIVIYDCYHDKISHTWTFSSFEHQWDFRTWMISMMSLLSYLVESSAWYEDTAESGFCYSSTTGHQYTVSFK